MAADKIRGNREIAALRCRSARNDGWGVWLYSLDMDLV